MRMSLSNLNSRLDTYSTCDGLTWYRQGELLANQQRYAEALTCFEQVLQVQADSAAAWIFRGVMLIYLENYREALDSCERAIALHPHNPEAWIFRGVALHRMGYYQQAYASYDRALGIHWKTTRPLLSRLKQPLRQFWRRIKRQQLPRLF